MARKGGRPTLYRPEFADQAFRLCLVGHTNEEMAKAFGVSDVTIDNWLKAHPAFLGAVKRGREEADADVAQSLYRRALGYSHEAVKIFADAKTGETLVVPYIEHYPPDPASMIFWLKNRQRAKWRDKQDVELTGAGGGPIEIRELSDADLAERARQLVNRVAVTHPNGHANGKPNGKH